jgi:DNA-directed RNA polymerase subunit RPC12/RpoP
MVKCPACSFPEEMKFLGDYKESKVFECTYCGQGVILSPKPFVPSAS